MAHQALLPLWRKLLISTTMTTPTLTPFRVWRRRLGISTAEAAERLGYGSRQIAAWERGEDVPRRVVLLAMAAIEAGLRPISGVDGSYSRS